MRKLILASGSPRRANLLQQINLEFQIIHPEIDETVIAGEEPMHYATRMSESKATRARQLVGENSEPLILCADTIVILDGRILGKPRDRQDSIEMLMSMSGRQHEVLTSVTLCDNRQAELDTFPVETTVTFRQLTLDECERYWQTGEPADKSGSYGIQGIGAIFVASISGSSSNVAGLPLLETAERLKQHGIDCLMCHGSK